MKENEISVKLADARAMYAKASEETKQALVSLFGKEAFAFDYTSIKSFEDACKQLGIEAGAKMQMVSEAGNVDKEAFEQSTALYKLLVIQKAINNGVWCDEDGDQWWPYWVLYSKEEMDEMSQAEIEQKGISQLLSCALAGSTESAGVRCAYASDRGAYTSTDCGFPLCYNSREAALYAAKQFESLFFQYYGIKVKEAEK